MINATLMKIIIIRGFFRVNEGVFPVKMKNAFLPVKCDNSVNRYSRISTVPQESEQSE